MLSIKEAGVFLSKADTDTLLKTVPRNPGGDLAYHAMLDSIIGKSERGKGVWPIGRDGRNVARLQTGTGGGVDSRPKILSPCHSSPDAPSPASSARPPVQKEFLWADEETVVVGLSLHGTLQPYSVPAANMQR